MNTVFPKSIDFPDPSDYSVISFDIFDTLVLRTVFEPRDVFLLMEDELVDKYGKKFLGFSDLRFKAELDNCSRVWSADRAAEFKLDDIYSTLFFLNPALEHFSEEIVETELRIERSVTITNRQVLNYFKKLRDLGKTIIFVSDTYLPKEHITKILSLCGYEGYDRLFISCEIGTNKGSGKLFDVVISELNVEAKNIIHIGDNEYSDIKQGKSRGLNTYQLPYAAKLLDQARFWGKKYKKYNFRETSSESLLRGLQKNYLLNGGGIPRIVADSGYDIGYQILGPICYGFVTWILQHAREKNIDNLYFIAREGWFLKKAFDIVNSINDTGIKSHYLYASRRALFFPFLTKPVSDFLFSFLVSSTPCKVGKYLKALDLELDDDRLKEFGFETRDDVISPKSNDYDKERLERLFNAETEQIETLAAEEKRNYLDYLDEVGILSTKQVGLVDSGWFGRGQKRLQRFVELTNPEAKLHGFYLALHERAQRNFDQVSEGYGYLYQFGNFKNDNKTFLEFAQMVEVFLSAPAESLKKIVKTDEGLCPRFMRDNTDPTLYPTIEQIHAGAIAFIQDFIKVPTQSLPTIPNHLAAHLLEHLIENPTPEEAMAIGTLPYDANVLAEDDEANFAFSKLSTIDFLRNPRRLNEEFKHTFWRSAYYENHRSKVIRLYLSLTEKYLINRHESLAKIYSIVQRVYRKISRR